MDDITESCGPKEQNEKDLVKLPEPLVQNTEKGEEEVQQDKEEEEEVKENDQQLLGSLMIAEVPLKDVEEKNRLNNVPHPPALPMGPLVDSQGLILPRKVFNPCLDSKDRQDLHKELLFNQRIGKNVLNQKSELQKALEKHKDLQTKKELENERNQNKSLLERVIEERARKIESMEKKEEAASRLPEFMQVHAKLRSSSKEAK